MVNKAGFTNDHLVLQWHITERCNLRCAHCYQESYTGKELSFQELLIVIEQFKDLLDKVSSGSRIPVRGHITVTGGEPFIRKDFLDLLEVFHANRDRFSFAILTNGSFIDVHIAHQLRRLNPSFIQVSLEGTKLTNDKIRGPGAYESTISALTDLVRERINTMLSFTAHRHNFREFEDVARLGCELGVSRVWSDRFIPCGSAHAMNETELSTDETREFFEVMYRAKNKAMLRFSRTEISMHRALQFLIAGGQPYRCTAGDTLITIHSNGDLYPCRRMPERVGNVLETPLSELYFRSDFFSALRDRNRMSEGCEECDFFSKCRGGLKCLSYARTGDPFKADPGCWRSGALLSDKFSKSLSNKNV
jgi:radical SAM protein with 4Fe4S-binding SPASM domain